MTGWTRDQQVKDIQDKSLMTQKGHTLIESLTTCRIAGWMPRSQDGYSMVELLTTVAVAAVLLSVSVPSMTSLVRGNRIVSETNEFIATINLARAEALNNVLQVTVCKSRNQVSCDGSAAWHDGWIVFVDNDENEQRDLTGATETLLLVHEELGGSNTLQSAAFSNWIAFRPNGLAIGNVANAGMFSLCNDAGATYGRDISISRIGSTAIENADGACP